MNAELMLFRARVHTEIRAFFSGRGYLEVITPSLSPVLIPESHLEAFATELVSPDGPSTPLYLVGSPELWHKRLLSQGSGSIFEIARCFRNGEQKGAHHNPEFNMLEYYTVDADHIDSIAITESLFGHLLDTLHDDLRRLGRTKTDLQRLKPPFERRSIRQVVLERTGIDLNLTAEPKQLREATTEIGLNVDENETWSDTFHRILVDRVEPELPTDRPLVLTDYPAAIPTLARKGADSRYSDRWELYAFGMELANCYAEETDPLTVQTFFSEQLAAKKNSRVPHRVDTNFYRIFDEHFPRCSGVAMGVDRLVMILAGEINMSRVILFGMSDIL
jgi:elongation factor P--(R)-beta-lysine ligase